MNELIMLQPKRPISESRRTYKDSYSTKEGYPPEAKHSGPFTPSRLRPLSEIKPNNSQEKCIEVRTTKNDRVPKDMNLLGGFNSHKPGAEPARDLYHIREKDKENIPREKLVEGRASEKRVPKDVSNRPLQVLGHYQTDLFNSHSGREISNKNQAHGGKSDNKLEKSLNSR